MIEIHDDARPPFGDTTIVLDSKTVTYSPIIMWQELRLDNFLRYPVMKEHNLGQS